MNKDISFALICEGSSDEALVSPLRELLVRSGASSAAGYADYTKGTIEQKCARLKDARVDLDLLFVHRDMDRATRVDRMAEITEGHRASGLKVPAIAVLPKRMTESWLLADKLAVKLASGAGSAWRDNIPALSSLEGLADPKARLKQAVTITTGKSGRRRKEELREFSRAKGPLAGAIGHRGAGLTDVVVERVGGSGRGLRKG